MGTNDLGGIRDSDELRPVTALFADVVGSTRLGERLAPSEVKALIGECVSRMCEAVESYGGCIRSYMGDGIAGFFGIDTASEDDIERAARAALEIRELMTDYSAEVESAWAIKDFNVRIGINAGRVAVGEVGSVVRPQRVALGDPVNVAARLQSIAEPGAIVVGEDVASRLRNRFVLRHLGSLTVKGKDSPVEAYELESRDSLAGRSHISRTLIGRINELSAIDAAIAELRNGRGQICFVLGEAGIGKSRLVQEARLRTPSDVLWLQGSCDAMDQRLPYEPLVQPIRGWLGTESEAMTPIAMRTRLSARGRELLGSAFDDVGPFLARLLGMRLETKIDRRLDGLPLGDSENGLAQAYLVWLRTLARTTPVVLAIENFESASDATAKVIHELLRQMAITPVLLLLTMRPEAREPALSVRTRALSELVARSFDVRLGPLAEDESARLVEVLDADHGLDDRLRRLVARRSEGNPLYVEQLIGAITADASRSITRVTLPDPLVSLLLARIDRLPTNAKALLQCAAVLGRSFSYDALVAMATSEEADDALAVLLRSDVIRERSHRPRTFVFHHGLLMEAALSTLSAERVRTLNARAAIALLQCSEGVDSERQVERIARHYLASGDLTNAVEYLERLADKYALISRCAEAADLIQKCIDQVVDAGDEDVLIRLVQKQSQALALMGDVDGAILALERAEAVARKRLGRRELGIAKIRHFVESGAFGDAADAIQSLTVADTDTRSDPRVITLAGKMALDRGDIAEAAARVSELGDVADLEGELGFEASSLKCAVLLHQGLLDEAETWALRAQALADRTGQIALQLAARRRVALVCVLKGCLQEAHERMKSVFAQCSRLGFSSGMVDTAMNVLYIATQSGVVGEAAEIGAKALKVAPSPFLEGLLAVNLSTVELMRGDCDECKRLARRALEHEELLPSWARVAARLALAYAEEDRGGESKCEGLLLDTFDMAERECSEREIAAIAYTIAAFYLGSERHEAAKPFAAYASERIGLLEGSMVLDVRRVLLLLKDMKDEARIAELAGLVREARVGGFRVVEALTLIELAKLDADRSADYFAEAETMIRECRAEYYLRFLPDGSRTPASAVQT